MPRVFVIQHTVEGEFCRFGVERRAILKRHVFPQMKAIAQAIRTDFPMCCKGGLDIQLAFAITYQPVVDVDQNTRIVRRRGDLRVEGLRLGNLAY